MAQLLGIISLVVGLYLFSQFVRLFADGRWREGCIGIGSLIVAYFVWQQSLPVIFFAGADSIGQMLIGHQLTLILTYVTGLLVLYFLSGIARTSPGQDAAAAPEASPPLPAAAASVAGAPRHCPACGTNWTTPPDDCPRCGTAPS